MQILTIGLDVMKNMCIGIFVYPKTESQSFHISDKTSYDLYLNVK